MVVAMTDDADPLFDVDVDPVTGIATLRVDPATHGWEVETRVESSREYLGDDVEHAEASATCFLVDPDDLREVAETLEVAADRLETAQEDGDQDGGRDE